MSLTPQELEWQRTYRKRHHDAIVERERVWRLEHPGYNAFATRKWGLSHPEELKLKRKKDAEIRSPEYGCAATLKYEKAHPDKMRVRNQLRRALLLGAIGDEPLTENEWNEILTAFDFHCAYCGIKSDHLTMDHVIPLAGGGKHTKNNIVPACQHCNSSKSNRTPQEWGREIQYVKCTQ